MLLPEDFTMKVTKSTKMVSRRDRKDRGDDLMLVVRLANDAQMTGGRGVLSPFDPRAGAGAHVRKGNWIPDRVRNDDGERKLTGGP